MNNEVDKNSKLNSLQGLRLLAFLLIYLNHSFWLLGIGKIFDFGARGVEIFFVLSGFLVAYNYGDRVFDCSWKNCTLYAYNKLKKFYILHFITFLLFLYYPTKEYIRGGLSSTKIHTLIIDCVLNITLLKSWYFPSAFSLNGVTWFLSTILFAYFLVPKIVMYLRQRDNSLYVLLFCILISLKMILDTYGYKFPHNFHAFSLYTNPLYRLQDFVLGYVFFMAVKRSLNEPQYNMHKIAQFIIPLMYVVSCFLFDKNWVPAPFILLTCLLVYLLSFPNNIYENILGNKILVILGNISFEMFILHNLMIKYTDKFWRIMGMEPKGVVFWVVSLLITVSVSWIVHNKPWKRINREFV